MSQIHDNHPGLKKFRQFKAQQKKIAEARKAFPGAKTNTIALNLMKRQDTIVRQKINHGEIFDRIDQKIHGS